MAENSLESQIAVIMEKAVRSLDAAKTLLTSGSSDFSSSRSYYAVFYALQALLLTKGLVFSKHAGVIAGFSEHFIRTGLFPKEHAKHISRLFRERHIGDYDFDHTITSEDAAEDLEIAGELVETAREFLSKQGYL